MRSIIRVLLLLPVFIASVSLCYGQAPKCNGALGDPVISEDFGSGANPGPPLSGSVTNMSYTTSGCPNDNYYTIANSIGDCFGDTWQFFYHDHTGNLNGYMMIVNASYQPSVFFTKQTLAGQLCPNTTYEFAAWIMNLDIPSACGGTPILPNITFTISTASGTVLQTYNTGDIPTTSSVNWVQYRTFFSTPANSSEAIVVTMTNNAPGGCGNDLALDDITFRACGPVVEDGFSTVGGSKNQSMCQGGSATYTLKAQVISEGAPSLQWQARRGANPWTDIPGATADSLMAPFINAGPDVYQYRLGVSNGSVITDAACRVYSQPLSVYVNPLPVIPPFPDQKVCEGDQLVLSAPGGANYTWTGPGLAPTSQNPLVINNVTPANAGTYTVVAVSDSGCTVASVQANVTVVPRVVPGISGNVTLCAGESAQLAATGGLFYKWTPLTGLDNDTLANPMATPLQTTTYTAHISNGGCVDSSKSVTVTVNQNPVANAGENIVLYEGQSAKLNGTIAGDNITGYYWTPATFLANPNSLTPITTPTDNITYTLTGVSATCGTSASSVYVRVYKKVTIPNAFSPNGDGINDDWDIKALNTYPESITQVFDRYGRQVFQSTGYARPWDGTNNGQALPAGTYYYIIDLKDRQPKLSGWVLVVR